MSNYELNKGKLIPFNLTEDDIEQLVRVKGEKLRYSSYLDQFLYDYGWQDEGLVHIKGEWYRVEFEIDNGDVNDGFAFVTENEDGTIEFFTHHHNGGAHWTEVVEGALNGKR